MPAVTSCHDHTYLTTKLELCGYKAVAFLILLINVGVGVGVGVTAALLHSKITFSMQNVMKYRVYL